MNEIIGARPQRDIVVGPVKVDTGSAWLDLAFALIIVLVAAFVMGLAKRRAR